MFSKIKSYVNRQLTITRYRMLLKELEKNNRRRFVLIDVEIRKLIYKNFADILTYLHEEDVVKLLNISNDDEIIRLYKRYVDEYNYSIDSAVKQVQINYQHLHRKFNHLPATISTLVCQLYKIDTIKHLPELKNEINELVSSGVYGFQFTNKDRAIYLTRLAQIMFNLNEKDVKA